MRRLIRDVSSVLILSGLLLVVDAGATLVWQEPVTAAIGMVLRSNVDKTHLSYRTAPLSSTDTRALASIQSLSDRISYLARRERDQVKTGDAIGQIDIPRIGHTYNIIEGTDTRSLEAGPGHYPSTAFPGMGQTVAVAGHRTTYLAPFRFLNELTAGNRIIVTMPYGRFTYVVQYQRIVKPTQTSVIDSVGYDRLVLSACNPLYSAAQRIIVFARLRSVTPLGPAKSSS
ncbi:MAG TPA: class E sortase [Solirubrobacteraceae bacterium]|jgi:sortase A|nr:class E sortase [Solirubrobacteraceae bacterium]